MKHVEKVEINEADLPPAHGMVGVDDHMEINGDKVPDAKEDSGETSTAQDSG